MPFKKLQVWNKAMELSIAVYQHTQNFPKSEMFGLQSQMRRAAVSVVSNIAEGSQRTSDKEFAQYILIARGSLAELETQRLIASKMGYLLEKSAEDLETKIIEVDKMLYGMYRKLVT